MPEGDDHPDGRSSQARGYVLASRVTSIGLQMAVPPVIGWWVDLKWGLSPLFLIFGAVFGLVVSFFELLRFAKESSRPRG